MNVSNSSVDTSSINNVAVWYRDSGSTGSWTNIANITSPTNGYFVYSGWSEDDGEYQLKANTTTAGESDDTIDNIFRDGVKPNDPENREPSPGSYINDETPQISFDVTDDLSGVKNVSANVVDSEGEVQQSEDNSDNTLSFTVSSDNSLSDGDYSVEYVVYDEAEKKKTGSWDFTVDTVNDIDTTPEIDSWNNINDENGNIISMDDGEANVVLNFDEDDEEPESVTCYDGDVDSDDRIDSASDEGTDSGSYQFECGFDDEWSDTEIDLVVQYCDRASNCDNADLDTYVLDNSDPEVESVELASAASAYNSPFNIEVDVDSDVSGIQELEYFFDTSNLGNGETVDYDGDNYEVDPEGLDSGEQTVYVRAKDGAQKWSNAESVDFEYYPNKTPELSISTPENMEVTKGDIGTFDVNVENTGDLFIANSTITASTDSYSDDENVEDLAPGETQEITFEYDSGEKTLGVKEISVTSSYGQSSRFELIVRANSQQENEISSEVQDYQNRLEELKSNVSETESKLSENRKQRLNSNLSEFESSVQKAQNALDSEDYYEAQSVLSSIDSEYQSAKTSYETVKQEQKEEDNRQMFMMVGAVVLLLLAGTGGFFLVSDDYDLNPERLTDSDINIGSFDDLAARVRTIFKNESEAEEFEWDGFSE